MFCANCGTKFVGEYCSSCGSPKSVDAHPRQPDAPQGSSKKPRTKPSKLSIAISAALLVATIATSVLGFLALQERAKWEAKTISDTLRKDELDENQLDKYWELQDCLADPRELWPGYWDDCSTESSEFTLAETQADGIKLHIANDQKRSNESLTQALALFGAGLLTAGAGTATWLIGAKRSLQKGSSTTNS